MFVNKYFCYMKYKRMIDIFVCLFVCLFFLFFRNLAKSQQRLVKLGNALDKVDREVAEMRKRYALTAVITTNYPNFQVM